MKRMGCVLLILAFILSLCPVSASASESDHSLNSITVVVDKDGTACELSLPIIIKDGEFYIEPQNLADITRFQFSSDGGRLIFTLGLKSLLIDVINQTFEVNLTGQTFSGTLFVDGTHFLPMSEMLPWMNVQCYVSNDKLHIDSDIKSYWEVIEDFHPQDYLFDLAETYGETTGSIVGLCAISLFDCILDLDSIWRRSFSIDGGDTSLYEYKIYKECFREFALPEVGTEAEVQKLLSEMSEVVSDGSQFLNAYYTPIFTQETHDKIEALFGEDIAEGFEEWPIDATQISESLKLAKKALKYTKISVLYARIAMTDTTDYSEALRFIYLRDGIVTPRGVERAACESIIALESQAGAVANAAQTILADIGISILEEGSNKIQEDAVENVAGDTIFGSLGLYLDIVDATLSLVWPVNDAYEEITKMTVYQGIQYDALNAYYSIAKYNSEVSVQDISNARTSALIFLKTARKCFQAQQDTFDLYGGEGVLDWQIALINDKILEFQLASLSEENDAICDKSAFTTELKNLFHTIEPAEQPAKSQYDAGKILSDWYFSEYDRTGIEIAVLVDVTCDGSDELITVIRNDDAMSITGSVYAVDQNGAVQKIEEIFGSDFHAGGFFGWYLKKAQNGYSLIQETFGMWQGYGEVNVIEYHLDSDGTRIIVNSASASSVDDEPVTDEAWEHYIQEGGIILDNASSLYFSETNVGGTLIPLDEDLILERANSVADTGTLIPSSLEAKKDDNEYIQYTTFKVAFYEDMTCEVQFNMAEWILDQMATYQVMLCENGKRLIKIDTGTTEYGDGKNHNFSYFYLVEGENGLWTYYGEGIGLTIPGTVYEASSMQQIIVTNPTVLHDVSDLHGLYLRTGEAFDELTVDHIEGSEQINFSVVWYRTAGMDNVEAFLYGNLAFFKYTLNGSYDETYGVLEFYDDGEVNMKLFETRLPYIDKGNYVYHFVSDQIEEVKSDRDDSLYQSWLLLNDSTTGWVQGSSVDQSTVSNVYMQFFPDSTMLYWYGTTLGGETTYTGYHSNYRVENQILYVDDCAYNITYMESTGLTQMTIEAQGQYDLDLSGHYEIAENEMYQYLFSG